MLSEQYYPILDAGALGRRSWLSALRRGSGFHFSASASQSRAAKYSFYSQHFLFFPLWLGRRQASLKRHVGLARGGRLFAPFPSFPLVFFFFFIFYSTAVSRAQVKINPHVGPTPQVRALKYSYIVEQANEGGFSTGGVFFFACVRAP